MNYKILVIEDNVLYAEQAERTIEKRNSAGEPVLADYAEERPVAQAGIITRMQPVYLRLPVQISAVFAKDLESALELLDSQSFDGCMTDLFFYHDKTTTYFTDFYGSQIAKICISKNIPVVSCTAGFHHSESLEEVFCEMYFLGVPVAEVYDETLRIDGSSNYIDCPVKPWSDALEALIHLMHPDGKLSSREIALYLTR